ncbi:hypothetical protein So717_02910 [Roseobacter cerasinus]|uniref:Hedgehog/Intein (Hint) domain-containing protein n=1 Tax=Roseobacter cerasinus TaxID=2602289 RepID=A0A640VJ22_9RHOB|nr:Hint domain-containing protein [Roseobacter cerasinus]GFE48538.1 hypothetical protein So717_02910 [Roseobacter cerasinus]
MAPIPVSLPALYAEDLLAVSGANQGEPLCCDKPLVEGDIYQLRKPVQPRRLILVGETVGPLTLAPQTELGQAGAEVDALCMLRLMAHCGARADVILLRQVGATDGRTPAFAVPVTPLVPTAEYRLVEIDRGQPRQVLAQMTVASFLRGTQITMADGQQRPVEALHAGDIVLTRDGGAQPIRWVGRITVRAVGALAPVRIEAGALNNSRDLSVSPEQRLLIHQRSDILKVGRADLLIKARDLLRGPCVCVDQGGFVDYHQVLLDQARILFAEGIAAEAMRVNSCTAAMLPAYLQHEHVWEGKGEPTGLELGSALLDRSDLMTVLQRAVLG